MSAPKYTPGPWEVDTIDNPGEYGNNGPDTRSGFKSYAVLDAEGKVLFDSANSDVIEVHEDGEGYAWDERGRSDLTLAAAAPDLLQALDGLMELERRGRFMPMGPEWDAARAAIAKATGAAA